MGLYFDIKIRLNNANARAPFPFPFPLKGAQGVRNMLDGVIIYNKPYDTNMCEQKKIGHIVATSPEYSPPLLGGIIIYNKKSAKWCERPGILPFPSPSHWSAPKAPITGLAGL